MVKEEPDKREATAKALLDAANSASERVSGLHVAFMAICVYVLVIVFATTDLDVLMGKGVRLPVVNVDVPIAGFYAFAPFIVVLVHFNLLLQLQILSRKLFALEAAASQEESIGGLRDRLHIFPYTYYLVGRPSPLVHALVGLMVSVTLVLLPLGTLLALQLQFLAYQSETVTWWQRVATWLDITVIAILWPIILNRHDDWRAYWREIIAAHIPRRRAWVVYAILIVGLFLLLFSASIGLFLAGLVLLIPLPLVVIFSPGCGGITRARNVLLFLSMLVALAAFYFAAVSNLPYILLFGPVLIVPLTVLWHPQSPRGSLALLFGLYIGTMVPSAMLVDGERLELFILRVQRSSDSSTLLSKTFLINRRTLDLNEQILVAKPLKPETLALIRANKWQEALIQVEPVNLQGRSLRHANMFGVILIGADLRDAQLQGAQLQNSHLEGARLQSAQLQSTYLWRAQLVGADLRGAQLQGATLREAQLRGTNLQDAQLWGVYMWDAQLQGANLQRAQLQGADLKGAQLQGANLREAQLQGTDLQWTELQGANFKEAQIYGLKADHWKASLVDAQNVIWAPLSGEKLSELTTELQSVINISERREDIFIRLRAASQPGAVKVQLDSCLALVNAPLVCRMRYDPAKPVEFKDFTKQLYAYLGRLACESPEIAQSLIRQHPTKYNPDSTRKGLRIYLNKLLDDKTCIGLQYLPDEDKNKLRVLR